VDVTYRSRNSLARASLWSTIDPRALILALGTFAIGTDAFIIGGILPSIAHDLSVSVGRTGLVVSVFSLSYAVGSPIVSALSARLRRPTVLIGGLAVFAIANLMSALSPTLACLLATRVLAALAAGLVAPACYALASTLGDSHNRGKMLAIVGAGFTSAMVLGVPLGVVISKYAGWRGALIFVAILGAVAALCMLGAGVPEPDSTKSAPGLSGPASNPHRPDAISNLVHRQFWAVYFHCRDSRAAGVRDSCSLLAAALRVGLHGWQFHRWQLVRSVWPATAHDFLPRDVDL
jgi:predicted MFS family arabinose efflux permease